MLTGRAPFTADSTTEVLAAAVLKEPDWSLLPAATPQRVRDVLRRCLEKDPKRRIRDITDASYELSAADSPASAPDTGRRASQTAAIFLIVGAAIASLVAFALKTPVTQQNFDVTMISAKGVEPKALLNGPADESGAMVSPDGQFLAYVSVESGRNEIYVRPYSGAGQRTLISTSGGIEPLWSRTGEELFFRNGRDVLSVRMKASPGGTPLAPQVVFSGDYPFGPQVAKYDVSPDGKRFLMMRGRQWPEGQVVVVLNSFADLLGKTK